MFKRLMQKVRLGVYKKAYWRIFSYKVEIQKVLNILINELDCTPMTEAQEKLNEFWRVMEAADLKLKEAEE